LEHIGELGKTCWELHFELEEYAGKVNIGNTLGMWLEQHNPQKKRIYIICLMNGHKGI
jgi:hypothetical protein